MNAIVIEALPTIEHNSNTAEYDSCINGVAMIEMAVKMNEPPNSIRRFILLSNGCDKIAHGISMAIEIIKLT